jgi:hypothetical protein
LIAQQAVICACFFDQTLQQCNNVYVVTLIMDGFE